MVSENTYSEAFNSKNISGLFSNTKIFFCSLFKISVYPFANSLFLAFSDNAYMNFAIISSYPQSSPSSRVCSPESDSSPSSLTGAPPSSVGALLSTFVGVALICVEL